MATLSGRSPPSTARCARCPARSWPSWKTTSVATAASSSLLRCGPISGGTCSSRAEPRRTVEPPGTVESVPIRLVATDLDGTIVRSDGTISARTAKALARVEEAGAAVVLVTGRPPRWIAPVTEATGHRGTVICSNGALVYDPHDERVVESFLIPPATLAQVVDILCGALPELTFAVETG